MTDPQSRFSVRSDLYTIHRRLILLCAILLSGGNLIIPREPLAMFILLVGCSTFGFISLRANRRNLLIYSWISVVIVISVIFSLNKDPGSIVVRLLHFLMGLGLVRIYLTHLNKGFLVDDLRAILLPTAYMGIVTFFLALLVPSVFVTLDLEAQRMNTFLGLFNYSTPLIEGMGLIRPIGIFWEPGVFAAYLNILFFVLMVQKASLFNVGLAALATVLTQSTTGIAILCLQIGYFLIFTFLQRKVRVRQLYFALWVIVISPVLISVSVENIKDKTNGYAVGSLDARVFDFETARQVVRGNQLIGIGFSDSAYLPYARANPLAARSLSKEDRDGRFNTNGVMIVLYSVGVPLGIIYLGAIFFQPLFPHRFLFAIVVLAVLLSSPIAMTAFFVFLFFSGMVLRFKQQPSVVSSRGSSIHLEGQLDWRRVSQFKERR